MHNRVADTLKDLSPEDCAWLAVLIGMGLYLLLSERFWNLLPF
jgi:hypothetical protein